MTCKTLNWSSENFLRLSTQEEKRIDRKIRDLKLNDEEKYIRWFEMYQVIKKFGVEFLDLPLKDTEAILLIDNIFTLWEKNEMEKARVKRR